MSQINVIQLNPYHKSIIRRNLLKKAQERYAKEMAQQLKNKITNDNAVTSIDLENEI